MSLCSLFYLFVRLVAYFMFIFCFIMVEIALIFNRTATCAPYERTVERAT